MLAKVKYIYGQRDLLKNFVLRDFRRKYVGSALGLFWSIINPLVMLTVFTFIFSVLLQVRFGERAGVANFALYLFCGMLPWLAFQESLSRSTNILVENANLLKKVKFPAKILPTYIVISGFLNELIGLGILIIAIIISSYRLGLPLLFLPVIFILQLCLTVGICWLLAAINVFYRDILHMIGLILMVWMYSTPIFYPPRLIPDQLKFILVINPMAHLIQAYRDIFLEQRLPEPMSILILAGFSLFFFLLGYWFFGKTQDKFVDLV